MSVFALIRESFRFYRLDHPVFVRTLFLVVYALSFFGAVYPLDADNLDEFITSLAAVPTAQLTGAETVVPVLSSGNLIWLGIQVGVAFLLLLAMLLYAAVFVSQHEQHAFRDGLRGFARGLPRLLAFLLMAGLLMSFSIVLMSPLLFLVLIIGGVLTMYFLPLFLFHEKTKLGWAMNRSFRATRGFRLYILSSLLLLSVLINLATTVLFFFVPQMNVWASAILSGFVMSALTLMNGRLMGNLYFIVVRKTGGLPDPVRKRTDPPEA